MMDKSKYIANLKSQISQCDLLEDIFGLSHGMGEHFRFVDLEAVNRRLGGLQDKHEL